MGYKPIDEVTDVDIKLTDTLGLMMNDHSGVVELVVRTLEHKRRGCGCCSKTEVSYTTTPVDDETLAQLVDGYGELKSEYYEDDLEESLAWKVRHDKV